MHPDVIKAVAAGEINKLLMLPEERVMDMTLPYPIGISDFKTITGLDFNLNAFSKLPQFYYVGKNDNNDAYNDSERKIIYKL